MNNASPLIIELEIQKKVFQGYGLAEYKGKKIFVPYGVPGDLLEVELTYEKKDYAFGEIRQILKSSSERVTAGCDAFGKCGGCDWLNIKYSAQLDYKDKILNEIFNQYSCQINPIKSCPVPTNYRNKCFYPLTHLDGKVNYGMFEKGTHQVIQHNECYIQPAVFDRLSLAFCEYIENAQETVYDEKTGRGNIRHLGFRLHNDKNQLLVVVVTRKKRLAFSNLLVKQLLSEHPYITGVIQNINPIRGNVITGKDHKVLYGKEYMEIEIRKRHFRVHYDDFFQVNYFTTVELLNFIREQVNSESVVIDGYCGTGVIGIWISEKVKKVIGFDNSALSIENARYNAEINKTDNCQFRQGTAEEVFSSITDHNKIDTVIFDPPRKGLHAEVISATGRAGIKKIIYISCNPQTQKRDLEIFIDLGYNLVLRQGFDMFPHTWHIENVAVLEKR